MASGSDLNLTRSFTVNETAKEMSISRESVRRLIASGQLEAYRVGRKYLVTQKAVADYIAASRV